MKILKQATYSIDTEFALKDTNNFEDARFVLFAGNDLLLVRGEVTPLAFHQLPDSAALDQMIYVGSVGSIPFYTSALEEDHYEDAEFEKVALWNLFDKPDLDFDLIGRAKQLLNWKHTHKFCGRCGSRNHFCPPNDRGEIELAVACAECGQRAYPRLSPCVIMLVYRGDKILLAQRPNAKHGLFTVQSGFIEAGESAEQAVIREIREETGLEVSNPEYFGSQPWPFPDQLMLAYSVESPCGELNPDPEELENADWFDYRELPAHPGLFTISGQLIAYFVAQKKTQE